MVSQCVHSNMDLDQLFHLLLKKCKKCDFASLKSENGQMQNGRLGVQIYFIHFLVWFFSASQERGRSQGAPATAGHHPFTKFVIWGLVGGASQKSRIFVKISKILKIIKFQNFVRILIFLKICKNPVRGRRPKDSCIRRAFIGRVL